MSIIQKNGKTHVFKSHLAWQNGSTEAFPIEFQHYIDEGRLKKVGDMYALLNFTQARGNADFGEVPMVEIGDWLAQACPPHNRLFVVKQENFEKHYHFVDETDCQLNS